MTAFTITIQRGDDPATTTSVIQAADVAEARDRAFQLFAAGGPDSAGQGRGYVALGRGEGDDVEWLGAFDLQPGREPRWEADS